MSHTAFRRTALAGALACALSASTFAQTANPSSTADQQKKTQELEKIVVTGSRIASTETEGPAPVTVITGAQIKAEGFNTVADVMGSLTQVFSEGSLNADAPSWGSRSVNAFQLNLRGLGAGRSLLLIDGRRVDDYPQPAGGGFIRDASFQNFNNIPTGMIDRIEILATGASAIYGSDAIAGVVNVILKHEYQGYSIDVKYGAAERGGHNYGDFNFVGGNSGDNWHLVYNFERAHRSAIWGHDRPYTDSETDAGYGAWDKNARAFGWPIYQGLALWNGSGNYIAPPTGACTQSGFHNYYNLRHALSYNGDGTINDAGFYCGQKALFRDWVLSPGRDDKDGYIYGSYDFSPELQAYGAIGVWDTTGISNTELPFMYAMGGLPAGFYDVTTGQVISSYLRQFDQSEIGSSANTYDREQNWDIHAGLKGLLLGRFNWDASIGRSVYWVHESYAGLNEQGMFDFFFGPQLGTTTIAGTQYPVYQLDPNRFWSPITPAQYATFGVFGRNDAISWMNQAQATVTGDLFDAWAGPIGFAGALEANHQGYALHPDPRGNDTHFGDPFQDYNTGGGVRDRYSGAAEFRVPILSTLTADIAGRLDKYDDASNVGVAHTWSAKLEWRPIEGLLVRGTYGTNFHAPDMVYLYKNPSVNPVGIYNDPYYCITHGDTTCAATQHNTYFSAYGAGGPDLLPEKGHGWTYGFAWDVPWVNGLLVSADYWHMGIDNAIDNIDYTTVLTDEAGCRTGKNVDGSPYTAHVQGSAYCNDVIQSVKRDGNGNIVAVYYGPINQSQLYVSGIDAKVAYPWRTDHWGDFNFQLEWTDNLRYLQRTLPTDPLLNTNYNQPESKLRATLNWKYGDWDATILGTRIGGVRHDNYGGCERLADGTQPSVGDQSCVIVHGGTAPWIVYNASVDYKLNEHATIGLNVNNIFNRVGSIDYYAGGFQFIHTNAGADYVGREYFVRFNYKFD